MHCAHCGVYIGTPPWGQRVCELCLRVIEGGIICSECQQITYDQPADGLCTKCRRSISSRNHRNQAAGIIQHGKDNTLGDRRSRIDQSPTQVSHAVEVRRTTKLKTWEWVALIAFVFGIWWVANHYDPKGQLQSDLARQPLPTCSSNSTQGCYRQLPTWPDRTVSLVDPATGKVVGTEQLP